MASLKKIVTNFGMGRQQSTEISARMDACHAHQEYVKLERMSLVWVYMAYKPRIRPDIWQMLICYRG